MFIGGFTQYTLLDNIVFIQAFNGVKCLSSVLSSVIFDSLISSGEDRYTKYNMIHMYLTKQFDPIHH